MDMVKKKIVCRFGYSTEQDNDGKYFHYMKEEEQS